MSRTWRLFLFCSRYPVSKLCWVIGVFLKSSLTYKWLGFADEITTRLLEGPAYHTRSQRKTIGWERLFGHQDSNLDLVGEKDFHFLLSHSARVLVQVLGKLCFILSFWCADQGQGSLKAYLLNGICLHCSCISTCTTGRNSVFCSVAIAFAYWIEVMTRILIFSIPNSNDFLWGTCCAYPIAMIACILWAANHLSWVRHFLFHIHITLAMPATFREALQQSTTWQAEGNPQDVT